MHDSPHTLALPSPNEVKRTFADSLRSPRILRDAEGAGTWNAHPDLPPAQLLAELREAETRPDRIYKSSHINRVVLATLHGEPVVIKRYQVDGLRRQVLQRFRPSRARLAWAVSTTLRAYDIPAGNALGFVETGPHQANVSYAVFARDPGPQPARRFIKAWLHQRPDDFRIAFCDQLVQFFLHLYELGIYHADTKASNFLVRAPEDPAAREFTWIDLECISFGVTPTRRRVLRNLIQLNGSVGSKLSEADRHRFLEGFAPRFPWVLDPQVTETIRERTRERLERERIGLCGP